MNRTFDVAIIGNGILGLSTALRLADADPTLKIAIIGRDDIPGSATLASGAMLGRYAEVTEHTLTSTYAQRKFQLGGVAESMWPSWLDRLNAGMLTEDKVRNRPGTFVILNTRSGWIDNRNFTAIQTAMRANNCPVETVDPAAIPGCFPVEDHRPTNALYIDDLGSIDAFHLVENCRWQCQQYDNIVFIQQHVKQIQATEHRIEQIILRDNETINASQVCLAAGAFTQGLIDNIPGLAARMPMLFHGIGTGILFESGKIDFPYCVRSPNRSFACGLHVVPRVKGALYLGATNTLSLQPEAYSRTSMVHFLLEGVLRQINQNFHRVGLISTVVGSRPVSIDGYPLIGDTSLDNLTLMTGTYRDGLTFSPLYSDIIAKTILGEAQLLEHPFTPERPLIKDYDYDTAVQTAIDHYMAGCYEFGMSLPNVGIETLMTESLRRDISEIYQPYQQFDFVMPPDLVLLFKDERQRTSKVIMEYLTKKEKVNVV